MQFAYIIHYHDCRHIIIDSIQLMLIQLEVFSEDIPRAGSIIYLIYFFFLACTLE